MTVLDLDDKPHRLRELITAMMEKENVRSLAEERAALLSKSEEGTMYSGFQFRLKIAYRPCGVGVSRNVLY